MNDVFLTLLLSVALCGLYIRLARSWRILAQPNERSSHQDPTPHGGGVPLLVALVVGFALAGPWSFSYLWLVMMALALMLLGVADDLRGLSVALRFTVYVIVGVATSGILLRSSIAPGSPVGVALILGFAFTIVWALNLYNFMDGIDGIAATQCVLACAAAAFLVRYHSGDGDYVLMCLLLAASQLGFLVWNWAPARLFMGDAGSIPTGYLLAGLAGYGAIDGIISPACWSVLLAVFITDASWTLLWRIASGQPFTQAHRLHAYQRLSRHWGSHKSVVLLLLLINLFWLFPIAWAAQEWPDNSLHFVTLAYVPLLFGMAKAVKLT